MAKRIVLAKSGTVGLDSNYFSSFNAIATPEIYLAASVLSTIQSRPQISSSLDRFFLLFPSLSSGQSQLRLVLGFPQREVHLQLTRLFQNPSIAFLIDSFTSQSLP